LVKHHVIIFQRQGVYSLAYLNKTQINISLNRLQIWSFAFLSF